MELGELAVFMGIAIGGASAFFVWLQFKKQNKTTSADISLRMIDTIRRDEFRNPLKKISQNKSDELKKTDIFRLLNHYEYLAEFEKDHVLDFDHVLHQHGANIKMLYNDSRVKEIFDKARKDKPEYNYINLENLFIKINDKM